MSPGRHPSAHPLAPKTVLPAPKPTAADRLCASVLIARLSAVAHLADGLIVEAAAQSVMELRHTVAQAAHRAFLEKQTELDDRLRRAVAAFLTDLRAAGGPGDQLPNPASRENFIRLLGEMSAALEATIKA